MRFWNFVESDGERTLYLNGPIAEETWWGNEVIPEQFKRELSQGSGDITVWINSPGGDVFAAAAIYTMLKEYPGKVTVKIDALAASAASVVAMAGDEVLLSPVAHMVIHNPATIAIGDSAEMLRTKAMLDEIKESIINAYEYKTGMRRTQLGHLMNAETWMNAHQAVEWGFADGILYDERLTVNDGRLLTFSAITNAHRQSSIVNCQSQKTPLDQLQKRFNLLEV